MRKKKTFDCVDMKRRCQKEIRKQVSGMSREEEIAFFRNAGHKLEQHIRVTAEHSVKKT